MASVLFTAMSQLNAFLNSEMEQSRSRQISKVLNLMSRRFCRFAHPEVCSTCPQRMRRCIMRRDVHWNHCRWAAAFHQDGRADHCGSGTCGTAYQRAAMAGAVCSLRWKDVLGLKKSHMPSRRQLYLLSDVWDMQYESLGVEKRRVLNLFVFVDW